MKWLNLSFRYRIVLLITIVKSTVCVCNVCTIANVTHTLQSIHRYEIIRYLGYGITFEKII